MSIDLSCNFKINFKIKLFVSFMPVLHDSSGQWEVWAQGQLVFSWSLNKHLRSTTPRGWQNHFKVIRTIRINLEMINEPSSLSFIWRIIRIIIRRCESWNRPQQNSITESLKPCKFDWEFILDMQPEQMITKTRVSQSVSSETSCEPHTGNTEHYTLSILYSIEYTSIHI